MLKLKRVELQGFKSFCDRTEMRFNGAGIAAVVGPNGCGKSNLSDAISWVLGEQSAKSLRGSRMMDVIFAGTNSRKPLGMASVTMTLSDPAYHIEQSPADPANGNGTNGNGVNGFANSHGAAAYGPRKPREITITRRLYRSGESEYLIDGKLARLRDIQDLFMGTGLGPESYAIIEQGRIGQILSSRPQDRRLIIEEAAGISKFKSRRRLAEAKLEGARQNLARVFDILEEVGRQVNSLNRQAKKAERYKRLHAGLIVELRRTVAGRYRLLEREAAKTALDLNQANASFQELNSTVAAKEKEQSSTQRRAYEMEERLTGTRAALSDLRLESERTRGRLESQARQISDIELRLSQGETETESLELRSTQLDEQLDAHAKTLTELEAQAEEARSTLSGKTRERESAQELLSQRGRAIELSRNTVLRLLGEASQLKNELAQVDEYLASIERDMARAGNERRSSSEEIERLRRRGKGTRGDTWSEAGRAGAGRGQPPASGGRTFRPPCQPRRGPATARATALGDFADQGPERVSRRNTLAPGLYDRIGEAFLHGGRPRTAGRGAGRSGCWPISLTSTPNTKRRPRNSSTTSSNTSSSRTGARRRAASR